MDPRRLLGVSPGAGRAEIRRSHRRLRRRLEPANGGTAELVRLVDAARDVLEGRGRGGLVVRPRSLLGLAAGEGVEQARRAYRRLAGLTHPDRGGTDELFRVVRTALDHIERPPAAARGPARAGTRAPSGWRPPPSPPRRPPPPFRPPQEPQRRVLSPRRAWLQVAVFGAATVGVLALLAADLVFLRMGLALGAPQGIPFVLLFVGIGWATLWLLRWSVAATRRSHAQTRLALIDAAEEPGTFLAETCLDVPVHRESEMKLYAAYRAWCVARGRSGVSPYVFAERLRSFGLLYVNDSAWESGVWVGVRLRDEFV